MANELCAYGFDNDIDGQYYLMYNDHWCNGTYWIYKDSFNWIISDSEFLYGEPYLKAIKQYSVGSGPNGEYNGVSGNPNGTIALGIC
jgi:hypothetical protein